MATRPRSDIYVNLPALEKLDDMLLVRSKILRPGLPTRWACLPKLSKRGLNCSCALLQQEILDSFQKTEFWYVNDKGRKDEDDSAATPCRPVSQRGDDKWWLPVPCVTKPGLTETARRDLQQKRDCASQIHKAAMAINNGVLAEIRIPDLYKQALPKVNFKSFDTKPKDRDSSASLNLKKGILNNSDFSAGGRAWAT